MQIARDGETISILEFPLNRHDYGPDIVKCTSTGLDPKSARFVVQVHGEELLKKKIAFSYFAKGDFVIYFPY
jgi:hypothetical protein